jgi:hypothetical protein
MVVDDALNINGQTLSIGSGTINGNVTLSNNGAITTNGNLYATGGKILYWSSGTIDGTGGLNFLNGASIGFSGSGNRVMDSAGLNFSFTDFSIPNGSLTLRNGGLTFNTTGNGATVIPVGTMLNMYGGTITNNGPLNISGGFGLYGGSLTGNGAINMTGGTIDMPANSTVNWTATGTMSNSGTLNLGNRTITNALTNSGTINSSGGLIFTQLFTNQGTLNLSTGTTTFSGGYTQNGGSTKMGTSLASQGNMVVGGSGFQLNGGTLSGSGTLTGNLSINNGTLAVGYSPGSLTVTGNLNLNSSSTLNVELGGTTAGSGYDVIYVGGTAYLAGTLNVTSWGGYVPTAGSGYNFLNFANSSGAFSTMNLPAGWNISLNSTATYLQLLMAGLTASSASPTLSLQQALTQALMQSGASNTDPGALTMTDTAVGFNRVTPNDYSTSLVQLLGDLTQVAPVTDFFDEKVCR